MLKEDRIQRILVGAILLIISIINLFDMEKLNTLNIVSIGIQVELIVTGLIGWCPFYWALSKARDE